MSALRKALESRARLTVLAALAAYFLVLVAIGGPSHWGTLGVPPMKPHFADLNGVTSGWECTRKGIDVHVANPCDPWHRTLVYPSIWMVPAPLGLGQGDTVPIGIALAVLFFLVALCIVPREAGFAEGLVYAALLCSPAVMLCVERGNVDLLILVIVVGAVYALRRRLGSIVAPAVLAFATVAKLYPIFAAPVLLRLRSRRWIIAGAALVLAAFLAEELGDRHESRLARYGAYPRGNNVFGAVHSAAAFMPLLKAVHLGTTPHALRVPLVAALVLVAAALAWWLARRLPAGGERDGDGDWRLDLFLAGASVYIMFFAFFQQYDYRLVYLLLPLPQLLAWARRALVVAWLTIGTLLGSVWLDPAAWGHVHRIYTALIRPPGGPAPVAEALLFAGLLAGLGAVVLGLVPGLLGDLRLRERLPRRAPSTAG
jgi:Glycosyltransferase family 87